MYIGSIRGSMGMQVHGIARIREGTMDSATASQFIGIGPLAEALGVSPSLIRKMEAEGTLPPSARLGGSDRRVYLREDVAGIEERVRLHRRARRQMTIAR